MIAYFGGAPTHNTIYIQSTADAWYSSRIARCLHEPTRSHSHTRARMKCACASRLLCPADDASLFNKCEPTALVRFRFSPLRGRHACLFAERVKLTHFICVPFMYFISMVTRGPAYFHIYSFEPHCWDTYTEQKERERDVRNAVTVTAVKTFQFPHKRHTHTLHTFAYLCSVFVCVCGCFGGGGLRRPCRRWLRISE